MWLIYFLILNILDQTKITMNCKNRIFHFFLNRITILKWAASSTLSKRMHRSQKTLKLFGFSSVFLLRCISVSGGYLMPKFYLSESCHYHHIMPLAQISLTLSLSRLFSLSFIASGRSSGLHPVSSHSCCMYVRAGRPASARPYVGVHWSTSLMSSSLLLQQCPACLVRLTWIVFVMGGR